MENPNEATATAENSLDAATRLPNGWLSRWPWVTFILPMAVYMLVGSCEPKPPPGAGNGPASQVDVGAAESGVQNGLADSEMADEWEEMPAAGGSLFSLPYRYYPYVYTAKIVLTLLAMVLVWPGYQTFPWRVSWLSFAVGGVGVVLWIGLCHLRLEPMVVGPVDRFLGSFIPGLEEGDTPSVGLMSLLGTGERSAFNPLEHLADNPSWAYSFLAIRFLGLALLVPIFEEFFLRGFLMRFVIHEKWWQVTFGSVNRMAILVGTAVPMLMHPGELLASLVWFSMITWLMIRTRNIWDCVIAHAVTNLLLGIYVVTWDQWQLM